jgi:hypothetical protein
MGGEFGSQDIIRLVVIAVVLLVALGALNFLFKLTKTAIRVGCGLILFVVAAIFVLSFFS